MTQMCPECGAEVVVPEDIMIDEVLECAECAVELQVTATSPLALTIYEEAEK